MKKSTLKWMFLISFAALAFYLVCPKYGVWDRGGVRINKITGRVREIHELL